MGPVKKYPIGPVLASFGADVGDYRTGKQKIRCPFHDDRRPSAQVDFAAQRFTCWACGVTGDAIDLLRTQEGLAFHAAVDRAESLTGGSSQPVRSSRPAEDPGLFARPRSGRGRS